MDTTRTVRRCSACRDSEHSNYDDDVLFATIRDPETGRIIKRAYLCDEHRVAYADDGYAVEIADNVGAGKTH